jgi:hypothetical protein
MRSSFLISDEYTHSRMEVIKEVKREVKKTMRDLCTEGGNGHKSVLNLGLA